MKTDTNYKTVEDSFDNYINNTVNFNLFRIIVTKIQSKVQNTQQTTDH